MNSDKNNFQKGNTAIILTIVGLLVVLIGLIVVIRDFRKGKNKSENQTQEQNLNQNSSQNLNSQNVGLNNQSNSSGNTNSSSQTAWIKGNYSVKLTSASLDNSAIKGILLGQDWRSLEPSEGNYNWTTLEGDLQKMINAGKAVSLNIMDTGARTPDWVKNISGVQLFSFYDINKYQSAYCQKLTLPIYWDSTFLQKRKEFINALAAHISQKFGSNIVKGVMVSPFASINNDWFIPHTVGAGACGTENDIQEWQALGYSNSKMLGAAEETINDWAAAFPNAALKLPIGLSLEVGGSSTDLAEAVVNWAYSQYPARFYAQMNGLSAQIPTATDLKVANATPGTANYIMKLLTNRPQIGL